MSQNRTRQRPHLPAESRSSAGQAPALAAPRNSTAISQGCTAQQYPQPLQDAPTLGFGYGLKYAGMRVDSLVIR